VAAYMDLPVAGDETIRVEISNQGLVRAGAGDLIGTAPERLDEAVASSSGWAARSSSRPAR